MEIELTDRKVPFEPRKGLAVWHKGRPLRKANQADLVRGEKIIAGWKALDRLSGKEEAQILRSPKASGLRVGLWINFGGHGRLEWKRFVL